MTREEAIHARRETLAAIRQALETDDRARLLDLHGDLHTQDITAVIRGWYGDLPGRHAGALLYTVLACYVVGEEPIPQTLDQLQEALH